jgi:hypothetical protein
MPSGKMAWIAIDGLDVSQGFFDGREARLPDTVLFQIYRLGSKPI